MEKVGVKRSAKECAEFGLSKHRGDPAWILALEIPSHLVDAFRVVSLEAPRTEMVSLQVFVGQHSSIGIQKQRRKERVEQQEKPLGKEFPKLAWIWPRRWCGFCLALLVQKIGANFATQFVTSFHTSFQ